MTNEIAEFVVERIAERRAEIEELRRIAEIKAAELRAYEDVRARLDGPAPGAVAPSTPPALAPPRKSRGHKRGKPAPASPTEKAPRQKDSHIGDRVRELWDEGATVAAIAADIGVTPTRIYQLKQALNLPDRPVAGRKAVAGDDGRPKPPAPQAEPPPPARTHPPPPPRTGDTVLALHGVEIDQAEGDASITHRGETRSLSPIEAKVLALLLPAAPHPVNRSVLWSKCWPRVAIERADETLTAVVRGARPTIEAVGLTLNDMKGIGLSLTGMDDAAA